MKRRILDVLISITGLQAKTIAGTLLEKGIRIQDVAVRDGRTTMQKAALIASVFNLTLQMDEEEENVTLTNPVNGVSVTLGVGLPHLKAQEVDRAVADAHRVGPAYKVDMVDASGMFTPSAAKLEMGLRHLCEVYGDTNVSMTLGAIFKERKTLMPTA